MRIDSEALDWRQNLEIPFSPYDLSEEARARLLHVLNALNLRMGVFDLKLDDHGEVTWLEVNPQGQFLFSEGLSGVGLTDAFADFLEHETLMAAERAPHRSARRSHYEAPDSSR
ncbi:MAG: hypothetical protein GEU94_06930 [Micromonosporaceae bacterium]|nr:hypothetical protein [Micromonosporaceae bacterium]